MISALAARRSWFVALFIVASLFAALAPGGVTLAAGQLSVSRSSFDFGNIPIGTSSPEASIYLNNFGDAPLTISGITADSAEFTAADSSPACIGQTLAPDAYCVFTIKFSPTGVAGARTATLTIASNAGNNPQTIALSGNAQNGGTPSGTLTVTVPDGGGSVAGGGNYDLGSQVELVATANPGKLFAKWTIDGRDESWANPLKFRVDGNHTITATFIDRKSFPDVPASANYYEAVTQLSSRGIIKGYPDNTFGPDNEIARAQMAVLIVRAMPGWNNETASNPFPDRCKPNTTECIDDEQWNAVAVLASHNVARGFQDGTYQPLGTVAKVQAISFITRALVNYGFWQPVTTDDGTLFPNIVSTSAHRQDVLTFYSRVGSIPDIADPKANWTDFEVAAHREWFCRALWLALFSTKNTSYQ